MSELLREMGNQGVASVEGFGDLKHFVEAMAEEFWTIEYTAQGRVVALLEKKTRR